MPPNKNKRIRKSVPIALILLVLFLLSTGTAVYYYLQVKTLNKNITSPEANNSQVEFDQTIEAVGKLLILPADERPTLATVTDPKVLKDQPFFASAEIGDKVLIYSDSGKAILYRPSANKIINVAPLNFTDKATPPTPSTQ